ARSTRWTNSTSTAKTSSGYDADGPPRWVTAPPKKRRPLEIICLNVRVEGPVRLDARVFIPGDAAAGRNALLLNDGKADVADNGCCRLIEGFAGVGRMSDSPVRMWAETVTIPTYGVGEPDRNPMFLEKRVYQGSSGRVYPYPVIDKIHDERIDRPHRVVFLEN